MKKPLISTILCCLLLFSLLSACEDNGPAEEGSAASTQPTTPTTNTPVASDTIQPSPLETAKPQLAGNGLLSRQDIQKIYYGSAGTLLVNTQDMLYWYDAGQDVILAQRPADSWLEVSFYSVGDTLCAISSFPTDESADGFSASFHTLCVFYDEALREMETINLNDLGNGADHIRCAAISGDGSKIAYVTQNGLYCYDRDSNTLDLVLDLSYENMADHDGLSSISSVTFEPSGSRLLFCGSSFSLPVSEGQHSYMTYGCINLDGTGLKNLSFQNFEAGSLAGSAGGYLIFEESMTSASGKLAVVDSKDMSQRVYLLGSVSEGVSGLFCSQDGEYYATEEVGANSITLRVYYRATGELVCTHTFEDANAEYFYRTPTVYIVDSQNICVMKMGGFGEIPSKVVMFPLQED